MQIKLPQTLVSKVLFTSILAIVAASCSHLSQSEEVTVVKPDQISLKHRLIKGMDAKEYLDKTVVLMGYKSPKMRRLYLSEEDARENTFENCIDLFTVSGLGSVASGIVKQVELRGQFVVLPHASFPDVTFWKRADKVAFPDCQYSYEADEYLYFDVFGD